MVTAPRPGGGRVFLKDLPPAQVLANTWPLALIALVTLSGAAWLFRRRME